MVCPLVQSASVMKRLCLKVSVLAGVLFVNTTFAMDRWSALSMIESGDDDRAVGSKGEISRFQIKPLLWNGGNPSDSQTALTAAQTIMKERVDKFESAHKRQPTDFEFYVLWNAPAQVDNPSPKVSARAKRFANLVRR